MLEEILDILDKMKFFGGCRAGRELWQSKQRKVQDEDIENFNRDIDKIWGYILNSNPRGWIPVEERLPETFTNVLTCDSYGNIHMMRHLSGDEVPFGIREDNEKFYPVVAWMPLPKPYEGE